MRLHIVLVVMLLLIPVVSADAGFALMSWDDTHRQALVVDAAYGAQHGINHQPVFNVRGHNTRLNPTDNPLTARIFLVNSLDVFQEDYGTYEIARPLVDLPPHDVDLSSLIPGEYKVLAVITNENNGIVQDPVQFLGLHLLDSDNDTTPDYRDNCPNVFNAGQADFDADGVGDMCDNDIDGDTVTNGLPFNGETFVFDRIYHGDDNCPFKPGIVSNNGCPVDIDETGEPGCTDDNENGICDDEEEPEQPEEPEERPILHPINNRFINEGQNAIVAIQPQGMATVSVRMCAGTLWGHASCIQESQFSSNGVPVPDWVTVEQVVLRGKDTTKITFAPHHGVVVHPRHRYTFMFFVQARDDVGNITREFFDVTITDVDRKPLVGGALEDTAEVDVPYEYHVIVNEADHEDRHRISYRLGDHPAGMQLDPWTGIVTWTPDANDVGTHDVTVFVDQTNVYNLVGQTTIPHSWTIEVACEDADGDGFCDDTDLCPAEAGPLNGCPSEDPVIHEIGDFMLPEGERDTVRITALSHINQPIISVHQCAVNMFGVQSCFGERFFNSPGVEMPAWTANDFSDVRGFGAFDLILAPGYDAVLHPEDQHTFKFFAEARDSIGRTSRKFFTVTVVDVNRPPFIQTNPGGLSDTNTEYTYQMVAIDPDHEDELHYDLKVFPEGMTVNHATGTITWTPTVDQVGIHHVTATVTDGDIYNNNVDQPVVPQSWEISVHCHENCEQPPVCPDTNNNGICDDDEPCPPGSSGCPPCPDTDNDGVCDTDDVCPGHDDGTDTDGDTIPDGCDSCPNDTSSDGCLNHAPVFEPIPPQIVVVGEELTFPVIAHDQDGDSLTYSFDDQSRPSNITLMNNTDDTATFKWIPFASQVGEYALKIFVTDGQRGADTVVHISVVESTDPVCPDTNNNGICDDDEPCPLGSSGCPPAPCPDADNDGICDTDDVCPHGNDTADADGDGIPDACDNCPVHGNTTQTDTDGDGLGDVCDIPPVQPVNQPPQIISQPVYTTDEGSLYRYDVNAIDPDGDLLTYYLVDGPEGMTIHPFTGLIEWNVPDHHDTRVTVGVTDGQLDDTQSYRLRVTEARYGIKIIRAYVEPEFVLPGQTVNAFIRVQNNGGNDIEDARINVTMYDLGIRRTTDTFDLDVREKEDRHLVFQIPYNTLPGQYMVKFTFRNDSFHDSVYRIVTVQ